MNKLIRLPTGKKRTHGGFSFLASGKLPEHRREVERYLTLIRQKLIEDIAGSEGALTAAQLILCDRVISKVGLLRCVEEHCREVGIFEGQELAPALRKSYISYSNSLRLDLQVLGIERRSVEPKVDLAEIIRNFDERKAQEVKKPSNRRKVKRSAAKQGAGQGEGEDGIRGERE